MPRPTIDLDLEDVNAVYRVVCKATGDCYIGATVALARRLREHIYLARRGEHNSKRFQSLFDSYGECTFFAEVLEYCSREEKLRKLEYKWIKHYQPTLNSRIGEHGRFWKWNPPINRTTAA